ncbi:MAG TPA: HD domain-containing protein [Syntrophales bacterium]|nr:HD domain-containing protein [Syntrophales bacterium]
MTHPNHPQLTERLRKAINTASRLHLGQVRKGEGDLPYISHPFSVAWLLRGYTADEDIIIAGLLHDVLEHVPGYYYEDLKNDFGATVADIVRDLSEDKDPNIESDDKATWEERKRKYLKNLEHHGRSALMVCAADKIHNLQTMIDAYDEQGESLWDKFNAPSDKKLWFYEEILKVFRKAGLEDHIVNDYQRELTRMKSRLPE